MSSHLTCCSLFSNQYAGEPSREEQLIIALGLGGRGQHIDAPKGNSQQYKWIELLPISIFLLDYFDIAEMQCHVVLPANLAIVLLKSLVNCN